MPFKRLFQRCLVPQVKSVNGRKVKTERWINIEITDLSTNSGIRKKYGPEVERFLKADEELSRWIEKESQ